MNETYSYVPSHSINPKDKDAAWCRSHIKAFYDKYKDSPKRTNMSLLRKYGNAEQPRSIYSQHFTPRDQQGNPIQFDGDQMVISTGNVATNKTWMNVDFSIMPFMLKFKEVLINYVKKQEFDIYADAISPLSADERENKKHLLWAKAKVQEDLGAFNEVMGVPTEQEDEILPKTKEELEIMTQFGIRLAKEAKMEMAMKMVLMENDFEANLHKYLNDAIDYGYKSVKVEADAITKKPIVEYIDTQTLFVDNEDDYSKSTMMGVPLRMTIGQIRAEAGDQFTEEQYQEMAQVAGGFRGLLDSITRPYDNQLIEVFDCQFYSYDIKKFRTGKSYGNEFVKEVDFNAKPGKVEIKTPDGVLEREVKETSIKTVYGGKWIVGTDFIYDWGKARNIPRNYENKRECFLKFICLKLTDKSLVERCRGFLDAIQIAHIRKQNAIIRAKQNGWDVDLDSLDKILLDGVAHSAADLIRAKVQTGIGLYRGKKIDDEGNEVKSNPFEETQGGIGVYLTELYLDIDKNIGFIRDVTGINESMDASTPMASTQVGTQKIALAGAQNAVYHYIEGTMRLYEKVSLQAGLILQMMARNNKIQGYSKALGSNLKQLIEIGEDVAMEGNSMVVYGYRIEARPSEAQKQELKDVAKLALTSPNKPNEGGIEMPQYLKIVRMIDSGVNLKVVEMVIAHDIKEYKERLDKSAAQKSQQESENRQNEIALKDKSLKEVEDTKQKGVIELENVKSNNRIKEMREEYSLKKDLQENIHEHKTIENELQKTA